MRTFWAWTSLILRPLTLWASGQFALSQMFTIIVNHLGHLVFLLFITIKFYFSYSLVSQAAFGAFLFFCSFTTLETYMYISTFWQQSVYSIFKLTRRMCISQIVREVRENNSWWQKSHSPTGQVIDDLHLPDTFDTSRQVLMSNPEITKGSSSFCCY